MAKGRFVKKKMPVTTNNITNHIINRIKQDGGSASRINTTGIWDEKRQAFRRSGGRKGFLDVAACIRGRFVVVDTKNAATGDTIRPEQIEFADEVRNAGGIVFFAESVTHFDEWYDNQLTNLL